jgi:4-hydroxybenzoyl-CoA reductase subunit beta
LKTTGTICHVAPKSRGVCFATFSGDLAPALLTLGAEVDIAGPAGKRSIPLNRLYIGFARQDVPVTDTQGDGKYYLSLRPGEIVTAVRAQNTLGPRSAYDKIRIRDLPPSFGRWNSVFTRFRDWVRRISGSGCSNPSPTIPT